MHLALVSKNINESCHTLLVRMTSKKVVSTLYTDCHSNHGIIGEEVILRGRYGPPFSRKSNLKIY